MPGGSIENGSLALDELKGIVAPIASRYNIRRVYLFGSRARGDNDADSDYDFIILCPEEMGLIGLANFRNELIKALGKPVDFAYEDYLTSGFDSIVGEDRVLVYESGRRITLREGCRIDSTAEILIFACRHDQTRSHPGIADMITICIENAVILQHLCRGIVYVDNVVGHAPHRPCGGRLIKYIAKLYLNKIRLWLRGNQRSSSDPPSLWPRT